MGHQYLVDAVVMSVADPGAVNNMTKIGGVYFQIAVRYEVNSSRVERAIRHAVETAWTRVDLETLNKYFGNTVSLNKGKPTNTEFIARIGNVVRMWMKNAA